MIATFNILAPAEKELKIFTLSLYQSGTIADNGLITTGLILDLSVKVSIFSLIKYAINS